MMNVREMLLQIDTEIAKLTKVREALEGIYIQKRPGRPSLNAVVKPTTLKKTKRKMSAEGRARIAAAQKARWTKMKAKN